jgi:hypothetical protein
VEGKVVKGAFWRKLDIEGLNYTGAWLIRDNEGHAFKI